MKVRKRDNRIVDFNKKKIINAIMQAMDEVDNKNYRTARRIANEISQLNYSVIDIEEIQDIVEQKLMASSLKDVAKAYILYREKRTEVRNVKENLSKKYNQLQSLILGTDEESNKENSNKDTRIIPTMRDYIAGFTCKEMASAFMLPKNIQKAHDMGKIQFHDSDYSPVMPMFNCSLINLKDMLQNGTVISKVKIDSPHTFSTACNIAMQIDTQVASSQYGGNTINLAHLAPFVEKTREYYRKKGIFTEEQIKELVNSDIIKGVQIIQYQLITMSTTNG